MIIDRATDKSRAYNWIAINIMSCTNQFHIQCSNVLIELFNMKYEDENLTTQLKALSVAKFNEIHGIMV